MHRRHLFAALTPSYRWIRFLGSGLLCVGAAAMASADAMAVEHITLKAGPVKTSLQVSDLKTFADTGTLPPALALYRPLLTPTVQAALKNPLSLEPALRDRVIEDLADADYSHPVVDLLADIAPGLSPESLQTAVSQLAETEAGVTVIGLLEALPGKSLVIEGQTLLGFLSQVGLSYLEQTALSNVLDYELRSGPRQDLSSSFDPALPGNMPVDRWSVFFRDHARDRIIPVDMYWTEESKGPVVVLSHGFGADRRFLEYLAEHLASHGLMVVALEHPGSNVDALVSGDISLFPTDEFVERPRDVSFILDRLEDLNAYSFFLRGRFNLDNVTLVGHSLGGYTGLVLAGGKLDAVALETFCNGLEVGISSPADWLQCAATEVQLPPGTLADPRITQLVVMNPLAGHIFGDAGLRNVKVPTLFLTGTSDGITSVSEQQLRPFNQLAGPRALVAVIGGTHLSVGDPDNINPALTQVPFMPEHPEADTLKLRQYLNGVVLSFVMQQGSRTAKRYQPFLSPEYAKQFSTPALPIHYSDRLPENVSRWLSSNEVLNRRLTPTLQRIASLLHLELLYARRRIAAVRIGAIAQIPMNPLALHARMPSTLVLHRTVQRQASSRASRQAQSNL